MSIKGYFKGYSKNRVPLPEYTVLTVAFVSLFIGFLLLVNYLELSVPRLAIGEIILLAIASHKLSRIIAKDRVTSFVRAPFTRHQEGPGLPEETDKPRGRGFRYVLGQLITCPFCLGLWIVAFFFYSFVLWPSLTLFVAAIFVALTISDFLHLLYKSAKTSL